jgi:hypothetical protein
MAAARYTTSRSLRWRNVTAPGDVTFPTVRHLPHRVWDYPRSRPSAESGCSRPPCPLTCTPIPNSDADIQLLAAGVCVYGWPSVPRAVATIHAAHPDTPLTTTQWEQWADDAGLADVALEDGTIPADYITNWLNLYAVDPTVLAAAEAAGVQDCASEGRLYQSCVTDDQVDVVLATIRRQLPSTSSQRHRLRCLSVRRRHLGELRRLRPR